MGVVTMRKVSNVTVPSICKGKIKVICFDVGCVAQFIKNGCKQLQ
jgi:hypothetical protein